MRAKPEEIVSILREEIQNYDTRVRRDETGTVLEVGDGIATVYGLDQAVYGELVELDTGVKGMVMNLARDSVGVVLLGSEAGVREGTVVRRTGRAADVPGQRRGQPRAGRCTPPDRHPGHRRHGAHRPGTA